MASFPRRWESSVARRKNLDPGPRATRSPGMTRLSPCTRFVNPLRLRVDSSRDSPSRDPRIAALAVAPRRGLARRFSDRRDASRVALGQPRHFDEYIALRTFF